MDMHPLVEKQSKCVGDHKDDITGYKNKALAVGATPKQAQTVAFTLVAMECSGLTQEEAFNRLVERHSEKPWFPSGLTLEDIKK